MVRRKDIGSIASGIVGSFASRNNDVDGYWALGKLYKFAESSGGREVVLELLTGAVQPHTHEFDLMLAFYRSKLLDYLARRGIPPEFVVSATVSVCIESAAPPNFHNRQYSVGNPCVVTCDIKDDNGRHHLARAYSKCHPHDPKKESRSARADKF